MRLPIRCDGRDDLCQGYEDELNCYIPIWYRPLYTFAAVAIMLIILVCLDIALPNWVTESQSALQRTDAGWLPLVLAFKRGIRRYEDYEEVRLKDSYGMDLKNAITESENYDVEDFQRFCKFYYDFELQHNLHACKMSTPIGYEKIAIEATDDFFFESLGTSHTTDIFYSNVENGLFVKVKKGLNRWFPKVWKVVNTLQVLRALYTLVMVISISVYYLDFVKDTLLMSKLGTFLVGEKVDFQLSLLFSTCVLSIILPLLTNILSVLNFNRWSPLQKLFGAIFIIFVPTVIKYRIYRLQLQYLSELKADSGQRLHMLLELKCHIQELRDLSVELRTNENMTEHLIQVLVLLLLILIKESNTTTASVVIAKYLVDQVSIFFLVTSTALSFLSLVRGQVNQLVTEKNHFVPFLGKFFVLIAYYTTTTLARVWAVVLLVTPYLGLFGSLYHYNHGSKGAWLEDGERAVFDIDPNGTVTWFNELWNDEYKFESIEQFYEFPPNLLIIPLIIVIVLHPILSHLLHNELYYKGIERPNLNWITSFQHSIRTIISPPLQKDWELIYRLYKLAGRELSFQSSWRRSKLLLLALHALMLFEHMIMLVPLLALRLAIDRRNTHLATNFPVLDDEKYSTNVVNYLILSGLVGFPVLSATSLLLAYIYFVKWHPWSRQLTRKI